MRIKIDEMRRFCVDILVKRGISEKSSEIIVNEYLYGELTGKENHGLISFKDFVENKIQHVHDRWSIVKEDENYALIDGHENVGHLVGKYAMDLALEKAKNKGISLVGMYNMRAYLMPGYYAKMASDNDMIGIAINNTSSHVAPFGGIDPKMGTNPIGLSIPTEKEPYILDMATSIRALGEVRLAKKLETFIPEGMAMDKDGNPTVDPNKVYSLRSAGYKGYGLCLAIEMLAGAFIRGKMGSKVKESIDRGYLFIVIDPTLFTDIDVFKKEISELISEIKSSRKIDEVKEILIPGERSMKKLKSHLNDGFIDLDDHIWEDIKSLSN
jgi:L-2-hydroxycarboxylate dehydrogenase (NAD+)